MANLIRVKQLDQPDLSGFFNDAFINTGILHATFVDKFTDENISGIKTFALGISAPNLVYNTGNQNISGVKTFASFPTVNNTGIVYTLGNQDVSGQKRFVDQDIVSTITFNSLNQPSTFIGGFSGPGVYRFEVKPEYRPVVFPNPNYFYTGVNPGQPVEIYFNTGTSRWWYTVNNIFVDASPIVQASSLSARLPLNNWSGGNMRIYPTYSHNISHYIDGNDPIDVDRINGVAKTGAQTISGVKTFFDSGIFSNGGVSAVALLNNPLSIVGSGNNYLQLNIQNRATGLNASADLVITANNGTDNSNFINLGINNVGYNDPAFTNGTGLDGYLFIDGGNLDIGTRTPGRAIEFHAGGTTAGSTVVRINSVGLLMVSGYVLNTINTAVVAGTNAQNQGPLTNQVNIITTNPNNPGGVTLPTAISGFSSRIMVRNTAANPVNVYPANGARIDASGINFSGAYLIQNAQKEFYSVETGQWYSI